MSKKIIVVGSGNAGLCAAIAALETNADVTIFEKAEPALAGGNTKYTAGAMRFVYNHRDDLLPLIRNKKDPRLVATNFGSYTAKQFKNDLHAFNDGRELSQEQETLVAESTNTLHWLASHNVKFEPIYERQSFQKDGQYVFWGGLTLAAMDEGVGLFDMELATVKRLGGKIRYGASVSRLLQNDHSITGVQVGDEKIEADAVVLAAGGFEANKHMRERHMGKNWSRAKVRGTPHNTGDGINMAIEVGAMAYGSFEGCHATPMDYHMPDYGGLDLTPIERKNHRKICYFLGIMVNLHGQRFVDEGINFRNYTYAQFGKAILEQPQQRAWQFFDGKVLDLLYKEYHFRDAHYMEGNTLEELVEKIEEIDKRATLETIVTYNQAVPDHIPFDPAILDGKRTIGLSLEKSNWAQRLDTPPYRVYPVTGGITFTYGGLKVGTYGEVLDANHNGIRGLYACGELVGGVFYAGYPGGSGLTSGAVFGRKAGYGAGYHT